MNAQHLLGTTTQGIVNNYFLNGNEDIVKGTFEKRDIEFTYRCWSMLEYRVLIYRILTTVKQGNYQKCDYNAYSMHQPCDRQLLTYIDIEKFRF